MKLGRLHKEQFGVASSKGTKKYDEDKKKIAGKISTPHRKVMDRKGFMERSEEI